MPPFERPPDSLCLIRLSALGDVTHVLPILHTLRRVWPDTRLTWIVGRREAGLVEGLPGVELVTLDKAAGMQGYRDLGRRLRRRRFDGLLLMQSSLRAHLASVAVRAPVRLGFDRVRARDMHRLFINRRIGFVDRQHVLDGNFGFLQALGIERRVLDWSVPIADRDRELARRQLPGDAPALLISPGASRSIRNWSAAGYAAIADLAARRYGMRVLLCGGPGRCERELGCAIEQAVRHTRPVNVIGSVTLKQTVALMARSAAVLSPDSGPAHMAAIADTPVIGLYAVSNVHRTGPYKSIPYCVDAYDAAARRHLGRPAAGLRWGRRVAHPRSMHAITPEAVAERLQSVMEGSTTASATA